MKTHYLGLGTGIFTTRIRGEGWICNYCGYTNSNRGLVIRHAKQNHNEEILKRLK